MFIRFGGSLHQLNIPRLVNFDYKVHSDTENFTICFASESISVIVLAVNYQYILHYIIWVGVDTAVGLSFSNQQIRVRLSTFALKLYWEG